MKAILLLVLVVLCSGCVAVECQYYVDASRSNDVARALETWADEVVFSKRFETDDLVSDATLVGPGRRAFSSESGVEPPTAMAGPTGAIRSARPLGTDLTSPSAVFLGERSFAGVVIARESLNKDLASIGMTAKALAFVNGRVGVMCREDER